MVRCAQDMPFRTIAGHQRIIALLSRAITQGTLPPSLLLSGPRGIGKRRIAMAIAETLNCLSPASDPVDACGECAAVRCSVLFACVVRECRLGATIDGFYAS